MADFNVQEWGIVGVLITLFAGQIMFLQKTLMKKMNETDDKVIALINRWNRSDEARDRRHEDIIKEINDISDDLNFLKGRDT
jgi:hypothetical protein|tara:strand:+ start:436 stop:681 length:246 start_codon:yes stop_codon:yes gene_type:complete